MKKMNEKSKATYFEEISRIKKMLPTINNDISEYQLISLENKVELLNKQFIKLSNDFKKSEDKTRKGLMTERILLIILALLAIGANLISPLIGKVLGIVFILSLTAHFKEVVKIKNEEEITNKIKSMIVRIHATLYNYSVKITEIREKRMGLQINSENVAEDNYTLFDSANFYISLWLEGDPAEITFSTLDYELQQLIISILQDDLNITETNIYNLVSLAKQKIAFETTELNNELSRNLKNS